MSDHHVVRAGKGSLSKFSCDWSDCPGKVHAERHEYEDRTKGCVTGKRLVSEYHPGNYTMNWTNSNAPYRKEKLNKRIRHDNYRFQRHHVIPCNMTKVYKDLFNNLKLLGWDLNNWELNGLNLPWYDKDIVWHDLPSHRGCHPGYDGRVKPNLNDLHKRSKEYCKNYDAGGAKDPTPEHLLTEIRKLIRIFKENIVNWQPGWQLTVLSGATSRQNIFNKYSINKCIPQYPKRTFE